MNFFQRLFRRRQPQPDMVRYYDDATKKVVLIPRSELGPGVVLVQVVGGGEPMYMDSSALKQGPIQHAALSPEMRRDIAELARQLADVRPLPVAEWEDGFQRDRDPAPEIAGWLHLAAILNLMTQRHAYDLAQRKECFRVLVACFTGARDTVRDRSDPKLLPPPQVDQAIKYFFEGGYA